MKTFHFGDIASSRRLKLALEILMEANGPLTVMEIQNASRDKGGYLTNPGTTIGEIAKNAGYQLSDGRNYGQKNGCAVRFPDGKYRYWIVSAPGWHQRWRVTSDYRVVPWGHSSVECGARSAEKNSDEGGMRGASTPNPELRTPNAVELCANPGCGKPVPPERLAQLSHTCSEECFKAWRASMRPKFETVGPAQGGLF